MNINEEVACYGNVVVGPTFRKELGRDVSKTPSGSSMVDFRASWSSPVSHIT
jgi:hypothetical protein